MKSDDVFDGVILGVFAGMLIVAALMPGCGGAPPGREPHQEQFQNVEAPTPADYGCCIATGSPTGVCNTDPAATCADGGTVYWSDGAVELVQ